MCSPLDGDKGEACSQGNASRSSAASSFKLRLTLHFRSLLPRLCSTAALQPCLPLSSPTQVHPGKLHPAVLPGPRHMLLPSSSGGHPPHPLLSEPACLQPQRALGQPGPDLPQLGHGYESLTPVLAADAVDKAGLSGSLGVSFVSGVEKTSLCGCEERRRHSSGGPPHLLLLIRTGDRCHLEPQAWTHPLALLFLAHSLAHHAVPLTP